MNDVEKNKKVLKDLRNNISQVDNKILELLNKRGEIAQKIGELKKELKLEVYQPHREKEVISRIKEQSSLLKPTNIEALSPHGDLLSHYRQVYLVLTIHVFSPAAPALSG